MRVLFQLAVVLSLIVTFHVSLGVGAGLVLEWMLNIDRGIAVLTGVASVAFAIYLLAAKAPTVSSWEPYQDFPDDDAVELYGVIEPPRPRRRKPKR